MSRDLIVEAMFEHWGPRCDDFDPDCEGCRAWAQFAALEAEASEGERRGLEPTDAMVACFSDPMLNPEWVRSRLRGALALIPAPAREGE